MSRCEPHTHAFRRRPTRNSVQQQIEAQTDNSTLSAELSNSSCVRQLTTRQLRNCWRCRCVTAIAGNQASANCNCNRCSTHRNYDDKNKAKANFQLSSKRTRKSAKLHSVYCCVKIRRKVTKKYTAQREKHNSSCVGNSSNDQTLFRFSMFLCF